MTTAPKLILGAGLLALLGGCPLLDVAVEVEEVCLTYPDVAIEGQTGAHAVTRSFAFDDLEGVHDLVEHDADLQFVRGEIRAKSGISDFQFIDAARVTVASGDPASSLPPLMIYNCDGNCVPEDNRLAVPAGVQQSAVDYIKTDSLVIDLDIAGQLPAQSWTMDVDICMKGHISYSIEP